ncbi:MAG: hypothetical protein KatS3mg102_1829 [Planctomycetota bacterium]|nr:MAG: hypothetical protein KatS3mg102_1829 [Planctomycetota bacterium]
MHRPVAPARRAAVLAAVLPALVLTASAGGCGTAAPPRALTEPAPHRRVSGAEGNPMEAEGRFEGRLEIDPVPGGKHFQGTWLVLDGGERLVIDYRPVPEYFRYLERRVVVRGRTWWPPPEVQHIGARHLEVHEIAPAPGEQPLEPPPAELPAPPHVTDAAGARARLGRWAQVVGTLELLPAERDNPWWRRAALTLADGTRIEVESAPAPEAERLAGGLVTAVGRLRADPQTGQPRMEHARALCPGHAARCGMEPHRR